MARLTLDISMSLDGFIAGPNPTLEHPLGEGGERLHQWAFPLKSFRERHGSPAARPPPTRTSSRNRSATRGPP
jgi:hypothetical protein